MQLKYRWNTERKNFPTVYWLDQIQVIQGFIQSDPGYEKDFPVWSSRETVDNSINYMQQKTQYEDWVFINFFYFYLFNLSYL